MYNTFDRFIWQTLQDAHQGNSTLDKAKMKDYGVEDSDVQPYEINVTSDGHQYTYPEIDEARRQRYKLLLKETNEKPDIAELSIEEFDNLLAYLDAWELLLFFNSAMADPENMLGLFNLKFSDFPLFDKAVQTSYEKLLDTCARSIKVRRTAYVWAHGLVRVLPMDPDSDHMPPITDANMIGKENQNLSLNYALPDNLDVGNKPKNLAHDKFKKQLQSYKLNLENILTTEGNENPREIIADLLQCGINSIDKNISTTFLSKPMMIQYSFLFGLSGPQIEEFFRTNPRARLESDQVDSYVLCGMVMLKEMQDYYYRAGTGYKKRIGEYQEAYYYKCKYFAKMCFALAYNLPKLGKKEVLPLRDSAKNVSKNAGKYANYFKHRNREDSDHKITLSEQEIENLKKLSDLTTLTSGAHGKMTVTIHI